MSDQAPVIVVRGLVKRFGPVAAVDDLDFDVAAGSVTGFLGLNGAGKTTTLNILAGVGVASAGEAIVFGKRVERSNLAAKALVGFMPSEPLFPSWMTATKAATFAARLAGMNRSESRERAREVLDIVGLSQVAGRRVGGFSGGMRQRLGLAQAIVHRPRLLLLDEPTSALDPGGRRDVLELIEQLRGDHTVLLSTHILADVERICDRVIVIDKGKLVTEASIGELLNRVAPPLAEIDVNGGGVEVTEAIKGCEWAERVEVDTMRDLLRIRVVPNDAQAARAHLPRILADHGAHLLRFEWVSPTLEETFLGLVEGAK